MWNLNQNVDIETGETRRKLDGSRLKVLLELLAHCSLFWSSRLGGPGLPVSLTLMANLNSLKMRAIAENLRSRCS